MSILDTTLEPSTGAPPELDELFSRDPLKLTDQDLERIVLYMREARKKWLTEDAAKKTKKSAKGTTPSANINIGDLFDEGN